MASQSYKKARIRSRKGGKILWLSSLNLGASLHQKSKTEIMESLTSRGYTSDLITIRSNDLGARVHTENSLVNIVSIPLKFIPIITPFMYAVTLFFFLPIQILLRKPDYVIIDPYISVFSFALVLPLSMLGRTKLILDVRTIPVEVSGFRGFLRILLFTTSVSLAKRDYSGITMITPLMKKEVCERFNIDPARVGVWSSGVSESLFNPLFHLTKSEELREKLGLARKFVVLYHGAFSANRGLLETIEAMAMIKNTNCDVVFLLLGAGPSDQRLRELIKLRKLEDNVMIHAPVEHSEVPNYIAMCNIGIVPLPDHPYWRTQSPLKLLEYLAMGKVVVMTSIPAHQTVVGNKKCGIYITSTEPAEIAESILYAFHNREKLASWGKTGRRIVEEGYTWDKIAADLESYLLSVNVPIP